MELQKVAIKILLNVAMQEAKHQRRIRRKSGRAPPEPWMVAAVAVEGHSEVLVNLMQASRERAELFIPAVKLLRILCMADSKNAEAVRTNPSQMKRIKGLHRLVQRKAKSAPSAVGGKKKRRTVTPVSAIEALLGVLKEGA